MGALGILFPQTRASLVRVPVRLEVHRLVRAVSGDWRFPTFDANAIFAGFAGAVIGLAASEAAYMAEIARAGIHSVDKGQMEAAQARRA